MTSSFRRWFRVTWTLSLGALAALAPALGLPPEDPAVIERGTALGRQFETAAALYTHLKDEANGGRRLSWQSLPNWSGVYTRAAGGITFDPNRPPDADTTATLTPEFRERHQRKLRNLEAGIEYDPISDCRPPGYPRWLTEPFLREFVVTPDQTWLMNEMVNDIRRIYTDGREHTPDIEAYPLYNGDSIGFWDGHRLVIHTSQLTYGQYQRGEPDYTEQVETVEIWEKIDETSIEVDVWIYDPPALAEPWYVRQYYARLANPDKALRLRYWHCAENQNNAITETESGSSQFTDFDFTDMDDVDEPGE